MNHAKTRLIAFFLIFIFLGSYPYGCEKTAIITQKSKGVEHSVKKQYKNKPRLIVLPLQPQGGQAFSGIGLGIHFLLGNVVALHTGLKEFWFGWRVKKIFLEKERLRAYCRGKGPPLEITKLGKEQGIRYWLQGRVQPNGSKAQVVLILTDTKGEGGQWSTELPLKPTDQLMGFQREFLSWLDRCALPLPADQAAKALWHEKTTLEGLGSLGRALGSFYLHSSWGEKGPLELKAFDQAVLASPASYLAHDLKGWALYKNKDYKAAEQSFRTALTLNSNGLGVLSGLMWCAIYANDKEKAYKFAIAKADLRGECHEAAKASVVRRMKKILK